MSKQSTDSQANQPIASDDQSNRKPPPDGVNVYITAIIDEGILKSAKLYVDLALAKDDPRLQPRFLIKKGTILPNWVLEGLDNPPIEYFDDKEDFNSAFKRLMGEELMNDLASGQAETRFLK